VLFRVGTGCPQVIACFFCTGTICRALAVDANPADRNSPVNDATTAIAACRQHRFEGGVNIDGEPRISRWKIERNCGGQKRRSGRFDIVKSVARRLLANLPMAHPGVSASQVFPKIRLAMNRRDWRWISFVRIFPETAGSAGMIQAREGSGFHKETMKNS
jgi:hypothetical protein